jgi:hypothetical protein
MQLLSHLEISENEVCPGNRSRRQIALRKGLDLLEKDPLADRLTRRFQLVTAFDRREITFGFGDKLEQ